MSFKKILLSCMVVLSLSTILFSCKNTESVKKSNKLYTIVNPHTTSMSVFDKNGKILVRTIKPTEEFLSIIKDELTGEPAYISKSIIGEKKLVDTYESDGEEFSYDYLSTRVVLYDLEGKETGFDMELNGGIEFCLNNIFIYSKGSKKYAYNFTTGKEKELPNKAISHYKEYFIMSDYLWDDSIDPNVITTEIYDKNLELYKIIDKYAYDYISYIGKDEFLRLGMKKEKGTDKTLYNYMDDKFEFIFDTPIENNIYNEEDSVVLCKRNGKKFMFDFSKREMVGKEEIDTELPEPYDPNKYEKERLEIEAKFADIDSNANWYYFDREGKRYYYNQSDKQYNQREKFSLYDDDKNLILTDITSISPYISDEYIICSHIDGTKVYDNNFKVIKDFGDRKLDIWSWTTHKGSNGKTYYSFANAEKTSMGILDEKFNPIIDNLKYVGLLEDDYFTYMDGFEYGLMDYNGKKLFTFSIFDNFQDEEDALYSNEEMGEEQNIEISDPKNYPRVDGSTANMPMMAEIRSAYLKEDKTESENNVKVTTTDYAWRNLIEGNNDLLLVYEPSAETKEIIKNSGVKLKIVPIGVDALVFINNELNPIDNLSTDDLIRIYTGKATNWIAFNGFNKPIEAFQRPLNSGSQTLFLNLLMNGKEPTDAPKSYRPQGMDDLIEVLAKYNNSANAIGYSVYYYAKKMYAVPGLRLISVNGIEPNDNTIANGTYPFLNEYYLVIREDTKEDSETMKLFNFIQSKKGKEAIKKAGYIPR